MVLSQTAEHALRAVLYLARQPGGGPVPAAEIARALGAPENYLGKTLRQLTHRDLLHSSRGRTGGFTLARAPEEVTVLEVIETVDEPTKRTTCLTGNRLCERSSPCEAHGCWTELMRRARAPLQHTTVADLLAGRCDAGLPGHRAA